MLDTKPISLKIIETACRSIITEYETTKAINLGIRLNFSRYVSGNGLEIKFLHQSMPLSDLNLWLKGKSEDAKKYASDLTAVAKLIKIKLLEIGVLESQIKKIYKLK